VPLTQNEYDAMVSYAFSIGAGHLAGSQLLGKLNAGDYPGVANFFPQSFVTTKGVTRPGLVDRRNQEKALFMKE
jgi:lysozyme